jgi:ubiquinone/menaquinone biosynthesis C-methylase UbiE
MVAATEWLLDHRPLAVAGQRVVELGCGTGRHAARILAAGAEAYVGIDGSSGMLEVARTAAPDPRCSWQLATLDQIAAPATPFDTALIVLVLEHIADLALPFTAAARLLRPGGTLRIAEIHPDLVAGGTVAHFHDDGTELRFTSFAHPIDALTAALGAAGFTAESIDEHAADGALLARAPRLAKHRGRRVVVDVVARRLPAQAV